MCTSEAAGSTRLAGTTFAALNKLGRRLIPMAPDSYPRNSFRDFLGYVQGWQASYIGRILMHFSFFFFPQELSGVFEMRIYDGEFTVGSILEQCRVRPRDSILSYPENPANKEIDLRKLAQIVDRIPVEKIRARRRMLNNFYEEVLVSADPERGIAFSAVLMILAHYKVINDSKSLRFVVL